MLREVAHFLRHAPATAVLAARSEQVDLYETVMDRADGAGLGEQRAALVAGLEGAILEVGCGTGRLFEHYPAGCDVIALDPDERFLERAYGRAGAARARVTVEPGDATRLAYPDARFDAVVFGLVLCSVPSVEEVLAETARVLRPGGALRLVEHVLSRRPVAAALMHALNPAWLRVNGQGCNMNRDPVPAIERAGFVIEQRHAFQVFAPGLPAFPMERIEARKPAAR